MAKKKTAKKKTVAKKPAPRVGAQDLRIRKETFALEYVKCLNARKSAIVAGYTEVSAATQGSKLLRDPYVQEKINEYLENAAKNTEVTVENIINATAKIAFAEYGERTSDRLKALELLGKKFGIWDGVSGKNTGRDRQTTLGKLFDAVSKHSDGRRED